MGDKDCVFCSIAAGKLPSYKVYEDDDYLAFLDIFPTIEGQTLVIPKKHTNSIFTKVNDRELARFIVVSKKVANLLKRRLGVKQVSLVFEGTDVPHLHAKLYPKIEGKPKERAMEKGVVFFRSYPGYLITRMGPRASDSYLRAVQRKIVH